MGHELAGKTWVVATVAIAVAYVALCGGPIASASADLSFCPPGSAIGQCERPQGVAVNAETGRIYVADSGNNRVDIFETDGSPVSSFPVQGPAEIAVDNSNGPSKGDIYVSDSLKRIQKFGPSGAFILSFGGEGSGPSQFKSIKGIGVTAAGVLYASDTERLGPCELPGVSGSKFRKRVQKFDGNGTLIEQLVLTDAPCGEVEGFTVDSTGNFYLYNQGGTTALRKYDSSGGLLFEKEAGIEVSALAVDGEDNLFSAQREAPYRVIAKYNPAGNTLYRFGYDAIQRNQPGIAAFHSGLGDVFASEEGVGVRYLEMPEGPIAVPSTLKASPISNTKATLNAQINPEGKAVEYHFDYVDQAGFEASEFTGAKSTLPTSLGAADFTLHPAKAEIGCVNPPGAGCLEPETIYHFRVVVKDSEGKEDEAKGQFETKPPLEIDPTYATDVGVDAATLHAGVNPLGIAATGYFQYVDDANYQVSEFDEAAKVPSAGEISFGSGEATEVKSVTLTPLAPHTTYHYRLVADNAVVEPVAGPERTFTTFAPLASGEEPCANAALRIGTAAFLNDCRGYEMVSPLEKSNADILASEEPSTGLPAALNQSSLTGQRLTYSSNRSFGNAASAPASVQYVAARTPAGWQSHGVVPPRGAPLLTPGKQLDTEFKAFSPDLCTAWLRTTAEAPLAAGAIPRFPNLYRRQDDECGGASFEALTTVAPTHEAKAAPYPGQHYTSLELQGISDDGTKAVYAVVENLTEDTPPQSAACVKELETNPSSTGEECNYRLYQYSSADHSLHYVCVLPTGLPSAKSCSAGTAIDTFGRSRENRVANAISADGSRVFWSESGSESSASGGVGPGKIYLRVNPDRPQSEVGGECEAEKACTIAVSKKAEEESGTSVSQYWGAAEDGSKAIFTSGQNLYVFNVASKGTELVAGGVSGVMGASEDASHIYFTSTEDRGEGAMAGKQNLYLDEEGSVRFVVTLVDEDVPAENNFSPVSREPRKQIARVSPDGRHAAFMSLGSLTGYDNFDAKTGEADGEVYLYDATANGGAGELVCASCNPTGSRPLGRELLEGPKPADYRAAAQIPVWENSLYAARALSDDGSRLFFTSTDVLSPRDTNGRKDVYQWEAQGAGGCQGTDPGFVPASGGCLSLISSGKSERDSEFVDASPSGDNVFISTLASLVPQDYGLVDIYDVRVGGGFPSPPPPPPACEGEACQGPQALPNDPTPSSAIFNGAGNVVPPCPKGKVRHKGRCQAKKHQHAKKQKKHQHAKRGHSKGRAGR